MNGREPVFQSGRHGLQVAALLFFVVGAQQHPPQHTEVIQYPTACSKLNTEMDQFLIHEAKCLKVSGGRRLDVATDVALGLFNGFPE